MSDLKTANEILSDITGYTVDELIERHTEPLLQPEDCLTAMYCFLAQQQANDVTTGEKQCNLPVVSVSDLKNFIEWKDKQNKDYLGGKFMYDIKGYYKRLDESELLDYWLGRVHSR